MPERLFTSSSEARPGHDAKAPAAARCSRRRGQRIVLWTLGTFFSLQFLAGLVLDYWVLPIRFPTAHAHFTRLRTLAQTPEIIFFGSSRFGSGIRPDVLERQLANAFPDSPPRVFNAAVQGGDVVVADWLLERMLREGHRPRLVAVEVCPENLARKCEWLQEQAQRQMTWSDLARYFPDVLVYSRKPMQLIASRVTPLYQHRAQIRRFLTTAFANERGPTPADRHEPPASPDSEESELYALPGPRARPLTTPEQDAVLAAEMQRWLRDYDVAGAMPRALERLIGRCREHGIRILLVGAPVSEVHRSFYTPHITAAYHAYLRSLERPHACAFSDYCGRLPDACFVDHHHMGPGGAAYFSALLAQEMVAPAWREIASAGRAAD